MNLNLHQSKLAFKLLLLQSPVLTDLQASPSDTSTSDPWALTCHARASVGCRKGPMLQARLATGCSRLGRFLLQIQAEIQIQAETNKLLESCQKRLVSSFLGIVSVHKGWTDKYSGNRADQVTESTKVTTLFWRRMWPEKKKSMAKTDLYTWKNSNGTPKPCCSLSFIPAEKAQGSCKWQLSLVLTSHSGNFILTTSTIL